MTHILGVLSRSRVPVARSNQVVFDDALAFATSDELLNARAYHAEVVSWCRLAPFLPAPPETRLTDGAIADMRRRTSTILDRLHGVEGRAEMAIIVEERMLEPHESGRAYLRARAEVQAGLDVARESVRSLEARFRPAMRLIETGSGFRVAVLVRTGEIDCVCRAGAALSSQLQRTHAVQVSGPWPAYSFGTSYMEQVS